MIPDNIKKIIIQNDDNHPSFSKAYKKVISIMKENNYLKDQSIIWWLEDDVYKEDFHIICLFILEKTNFPYSINESCYWHYRRKFNSLNFENNKKNYIYTWLFGVL